MSKKTAIITGILGQDGPYLAKHLVGLGYKVYGMMRRYSNPNFSNLDYVGVTNDIEYIEGDLIDESSLLRIIKSIKPDEFYNLAAQSHVGVSFTQPRLTAEVDAIALVYLLEAIRNFHPTTRFYQASTSELFGNNHVNGMQDMQTAFHPRSPYATAKLYAHWLTVNYREAYKIHASCGILFNHESPIRGKGFVTRKITDGVAKIKAGLGDHISLGNLKAKRDWGFAGDYVKAMHLMLQKDIPKDYIVSTGETHSVEEFVELAFKAAGVDDWHSYIRIDPRYMRPAEVDELCGVCEQTNKELNWSPDVSFEELIKMMVEADIKRYEVA
jgi:GDPmannose 4,6-dehydratase